MGYKLGAYSEIAAVQKPAACGDGLATVAATWGSTAQLVQPTVVGDGSVAQYSFGTPVVRPTPASGNAERRRGGGIFSQYAARRDMSTCQYP